MSESQNQEVKNVDTSKVSIDKSRRVCTLSEKMINMLVAQMGAELANKHLYMTFANYFGTSGLPKLEEYFIKRADEEELHHKWIYWYLGYNDAEFQYPKVDAVNVEIKDHVYPFLATVDKEIETTMYINKLVDQAFEEKDWATFNWLMGNDSEHGMLVKEQVEEESISRTIADLAQEEGSWLKKQDIIFAFYMGYPNQK